MRTAVDIPDGDLKLLDRISKADKVSRSEVVRRAIAAYVAPWGPKSKRNGSELDTGLPTWDGMDAQEYQDQIRSEWDREWDL